MHSMVGFFDPREVYYLFLLHLGCFRCPSGLEVWTRASGAEPRVLRTRWPWAFSEVRPKMRGPSIEPPSQNVYPELDRAGFRNPPRSSRLHGRLGGCRLPQSHLRRGRVCGPPAAGWASLALSQASGASGDLKTRSAFGALPGVGGKSSRQAKSLERPQRGGQFLKSKMRNALVPL